MMIISSNNRVKSFFDVWILILVGYSCLSSMYYLAFHRPTNRIHIIINWVIEANFYLDLILSFFCEYIDQETNLPVRNFKLIVKHYLFSWFLVDILSVFPFEEILPKGNSTGGLTKLFRLFRMPRLIKLIDVGRFKNILKSF